MPIHYTGVVRFQIMYVENARSINCNTFVVKKKTNVGKYVSTLKTTYVRVKVVTRNTAYLVLNLEKKKKKTFRYTRNTFTTRLY